MKVNFKEYEFVLHKNLYVLKPITSKTCGKATILYPVELCQGNLKHENIVWKDLESSFVKWMEHDGKNADKFTEMHDKISEAIVYAVHHD